jgi:hypothetical protein
MMSNGRGIEEQAGHYRIGAMIARSVGVLCIALGFVAGMQGLDHPESSWLPTALGLIVTGLLAQGFALYCTLRRVRDKNDPSRS